MAKQVGPQERKPEHSLVPEASGPDEDGLGEFHRGPRSRLAKGCIYARSRYLVETSHQDQPGKPGGVHIRLCQNVHRDRSARKSTHKNALYWLRSPSVRVK